MKSPSFIIHRSASIVRSSLFVLGLLSGLVSFAASKQQGLIINEIQVANIDQFIDPSVNYGGWIELYNPTSTRINLGRLYISDDPNDLRKFQLPWDYGILRSREFKNIWFDHYDTGQAYSSLAYKQVPFKLDYDGGVLYLSDSDGILFLTQEYPPGIQRASYARTEDGSDTWSYTSMPTPEASNNDCPFANIQLDAPVVDVDAQVFTSPFSFNVFIPEGATLRYTTDGSTPTLANGMTSDTGHFDVGNATAIYRFRLFKDGFLPSAVVTRSFIYKDRDYYMPIVSVVTDDRNLFDNTIGAYTIGTNGISGQGVSYATNKNRSWERPVNFEYLVPDDDGGSFLMALNQECDFEVAGGWSRNQFAPNASFRLKGAKYYLGQNFLSYAFFKDKPFIKSKGVVVRNGGNDGDARIRDAATHKIILSSGFYVDCQETQPVHVFINGQFQFTYNLREPSNKHHGYSNYGIDTDEMDQFEINASKGYEQRTGDDQAFRKWMSLATQLANNPTSIILYNQICQLVDIDEYCNYMAAECYVGCGDWLTNSNNVKGYRDRNNGRFHLVFMDLDSGFGSTNMLGSLSSHLSDSRYDTGKNFLIDIFLNMLQYEPFQKRFIDAFCLVNGSVFESERSTEIVTAMKDYQMEAIEFEGKGSSLTSSANSLINSINSNRSSRMSNFRNYFKLSNPITLELSSNVEGASILANGQEVPLGKFKGTLHAPMVLTAKAPAGYRFIGWQKNGESSMILDRKLFDTGANWYYYDQGSLDAEDWKALSFSTSGWSRGPAPFGYGDVGMDGSADYVTTLDFGSDADNKRPTYYFRQSFRLETAPTANDAYVLEGFVDDGCVVYINGHEAGRYLMPDGETTYEQFSTTYAGSVAGKCTFTFDNQWLRTGRNVIAVEVHNTHERSSDIYWTAELLHYIRGENEQLSKEPQLDLAAYEGMDLGKVVATYEPLPDNERLADIATPIKVNEVSAGNDIFVNDYYKKNDWLELYNTTDTDIDVAGLYVSDDIDDPLKYQIPSGSVVNTKVPANGHLVLWADKLEPMTQLHTGFKLGNRDGEMVLVVSSADFVNNNAAYFEAHPLLCDFSDALIYNTHTPKQSVGRYPDGSNTFCQMSRPTIGKANTSTSYDVPCGEDEGIMEKGKATFILDLVEGWNWISHPMTASIPVSFFAEYANSILGQTLEAYYSEENHAMQGLLTRLSPATLYKVEMAQDHTYEWNDALRASTATIPLSEGWNWIGYPCEGAQTISSALPDTQADDGDIIIGQSGFSVFSASDGWVGTLSSLVAGSGYIYKSKTAKTIQLAPATTMVKWRKPKWKGATQETAFNVCDRHDYPNVMAIVGQLQYENETLDAGSFSLAAYAGDECRGIGEMVDDRIFLTVYGQGGEALTFKAFNEAGQELTMDNRLIFASDVLGSWDKPYAFILSAEQSDVPATPAASAPLGFYSLDGLFVASHPEQLKSGLYIVRYSNGNCKKVLIRK